MNYIVSGLERSGTSLMMQVLEAGGVPVAYNGSRPADVNNPRGYYELEGGKVIRKLMEGHFPLGDYEGKFIKITAFGLKFLPRGSYKVVYMLRDMEEVLDSTEKMDPAFEREKEGPVLDKLNQVCLHLLANRPDISYMLVNYTDLVFESEREIARVGSFLGQPLNREKALGVVDPELYRNRR